MSDPDLTDAISRLTCLLEEQCDPKTYDFLAPEEDSLAVTIKKMTANTEKYLLELTEAVDNLNETMKEIAAIQRKAMKWQEMFG